jgi:hypothetical protein
MKAREFRYAIALDRAGRVTADGQAELDLDPAWTPEHLVLAGLTRCTVRASGSMPHRAGVDFVGLRERLAMVTRSGPGRALRLR